MKFIFFFLIGTSTCYAGSSPDTKGVLVNETSISNDQLEVKVIFHKLTECKPKVDGAFCHPKMGKQSGEVKSRVSSDGTFHLPSKFLSPFKNFFEVQVLDLKSGKTWTGGSLRLNSETWTTQVEAIALFQWKEESLTFQLPGKLTFNEYVKKSLSLNSHFNPGINYKWRIISLHYYAYFGATTYPSGFGAAKPCYNSKIEKCVATSENKANDPSATLVSWLEEDGRPKITFWPHSEHTLPNIHDSILDASVTLLILDPNTGQAAGWAKVSGFFLKGEVSEIFQNRTVELESPEKLNWVNIN